MANGINDKVVLITGGSSGIMDLPATVAVRMPRIGTAEGPRDLLIAEDKVVQGFLLVSTNILAVGNSAASAGAWRGCWPANGTSGCARS